MRIVRSAHLLLQRQFQAALGDQLFRYALSAMGVVVDRRSAKVVDVASLNSSISRQKVLQQVGRCSVEGLASLDSPVMVD